MASTSDLAPAALLEIIGLQTEIAQLGLDLGAVMTLSARRVQAITGAGGAIVELAEGDEMVYRAAEGMAGHLLGLRLQRRGSLSGLCVEQAAILNCEDSEADPRVDRLACRKVGLRSMVVSPLLHGGQAVGVMKIAAADPHAFGPAQIRVLELISGMIGAAMANAASFEASELYHRATHDALTGLANRALFYDHLRQQIEQVRRSGERLAVVNLDMDGLKPINDTHGHAAGDAAITEMARRLTSVSRSMDTVARMGGDEFAVLLARVEGPEDVSAHTARMVENVRGPLAFEGRELALDASVGAALFPDEAGEIPALLEKADQAMYQIKRTRPNRR